MRSSGEEDDRWLWFLFYAALAVGMYYGAVVPLKEKKYTPSEAYKEKAGHYSDVSSRRNP